MSTQQYKTVAPFSKSGRWSWHTWTNAEPNKHAALFAKQAELGADGFDAGQADHHEFSRFPVSR
jgi:hypothetical protein